MKNLARSLESRPIEVSAPCRIDCGGTLDIKTFYYPLRHLSPCTFNVALNVRTRVRLLPHQSGLVKVSSKGFQDEEYPADVAPFDSPLGLVFALVAYFRVSGVHIDIVSESPPRAALGGSSTAAVALIAAISMALDGRVSQERAVRLAHAIEEAVAGAPCGLQDHLAAAYGGVHAWYWPSEPAEPPFRRLEVLPKEDYGALEQRMLIAYCGVPHHSHRVNDKWIRQFLAGQTREKWKEIVACTKAFVQALRVKDWISAAHAMNREVEIRKEMTPEVLDELGDALVASAVAEGAGARFTGAGEGGCIWALGETPVIERLRTKWSGALSTRHDARFLSTRIAPVGLEIA